MAKTISTRTKSKKGKGKKLTKARTSKLTPAELEKQLQKKEIRNLMTNMGFEKLPSVDGKHFVYDSRQSELDDIFFFENIVLLIEYTCGDPGSHLKEKKIIYDKINNDPINFIRFLLEEEKFKSLREVFQSKVLANYTFKQLQIKILYCSKKPIQLDHKQLVENVSFFDYPVVKYFESISKTIKKTTKYEFLNFLQINHDKVGENIKVSSRTSTDSFFGHILPEEHSSFKEGYKVVSFYIDAHSLMKRAYVLRRDGWKNSDDVGFYQRMISSAKIKSMRKYLNDEKRVFINNIIVTLPTDKIKFYDENDEQIKVDKKGNFSKGDILHVTPTKIEITDTSNIIGIIDGQHRTYAYHEGDDVYERPISELRKIQNLLVTGILYPSGEPEEKRLKFEAQLFTEINAKQTKAQPSLLQDIEYMMRPFSTVSIAKAIVNKLNESGPLNSMFEEYWFENSKLKTASVISFGLRPLVKFDGEDSLFKIWNNAEKDNLKKDENYELLKEYKDFCAKEVRNIFIGLKDNIEKENWKIDRLNPNAILNVTTINGIINCLRILIENGKTGDIAYYKSSFENVATFRFKKFKSSHYRQMGIELYNTYFK